MHDSSYSETAHTFVLRLQLHGYKLEIKPIKVLMFFSKIKDGSRIKI